MFEVTIFACFVGGGQYQLATRIDREKSSTRIRKQQSVGEETEL